MARQYELESVLARLGHPTTKHDVKVSSSRHWKAIKWRVTRLRPEYVHDVRLE